MRGKKERESSTLPNNSSTYRSSGSKHFPQNTSFPYLTPELASSRSSVFLLLIFKECGRAMIRFRRPGSSPQHVGRGGQKDGRTPGRCHGSNALIARFFQVTDRLGSQLSPELSRMGRERKVSPTATTIIRGQNIVLPAKINSILLLKCLGNCL